MDQVALGIAGAHGFAGNHLQWTRREEVETHCIGGRTGITTQSGVESGTAWQRVYEAVETGTRAKALEGSVGDDGLAMAIPRLCRPGTSGGEGGEGGRQGSSDVLQRV